MSVPAEQERVPELRGRAFGVAVRDRGRGVVPRTDSPGAGMGLQIMAPVAGRLEADQDAGTCVHLGFGLDEPALSPQR